MPVCSSAVHARIATALVVVLAVGEALAGSPPPPSSRGVARPLGDVERIELAAPPRSAIDALFARYAAGRGPWPVAVPLRVDASPGSAGTWERIGPTGRLWRLRLRAEGARFVSPKFDGLELHGAAALWVRTPDGARWWGPWTRRHAPAPRRLGTPALPGDELVVELWLADAHASARLRVESLSYGFASWPVAKAGRAASLKGYDLGCQRDVLCPEGQPWWDDRYAVAEGYDGVGVCSGTLVRATEGCEFLYLTAEHCEWWVDPQGMVFYWRYESPGCGQAAQADWVATTGSVDLVHDAALDVQLLALDPTDFTPDISPRLQGWDRSDQPPAMAASLSFPDDQPMQITVSNEAVDPCLPNGCDGGWGPQWWRVWGWDVGVTQGGSSGAALLDESHRVRGTLSGGLGYSCSTFVWDEFAKLSTAWNLLAPYLDPAGTGAVQTDSVDWLACQCPCGPHGTCVGPLAAQPVCSCDAGWSGAQCERRCTEPFADVDLDGATTVTDVQCLVLSVLAALDAAPQPPACLAVPPATADLDCNGSMDVTDASLGIHAALGLPLAPLVDGNVNGCPDACEGL